MARNQKRTLGLGRHFKSGNSSKSSGIYAWWKCNIHSSSEEKTTLLPTPVKNKQTSETQDTCKENSQRKIAISQIIPVMVKNIMLVSFGMTVGYPTVLIPSLSKPHSDEDIHLDEEQISWVGSISMLSLPLGCVVSGVIAQAIGRKPTMQISSVLLVACWTIFRFCTEVWQIYLALIVIGLTAGLLESPVLSYVAEITQPHLRGALLSSGSVAITLGIFLEFIFGSIMHWRTVGLVSAIPPVAYFILSFCIPESPYWLIMKNKTSEARESLARVRGWSSVEKIEQEFQDIVSSSSEKHAFKFGDYVKLQFIHPFLLVCYLFLYYHFSGLSTIQVYAVKLFEVLEVPVNEYDATVVLGLIQFLGCLTCVLIIPYTGKRILTFISILVATVGLIITATYAYLSNIKYLYDINEIVDNGLRDYKWIPLVFILMAELTLNCSVRTLPWTLAVEVFSIETRSVGTGALGCIFYCIGFIANKAFLDTIATITLPGVFWIYGAVGLISLVILYFWLPETEGKMLTEITDHFAGKAKLDNKVRRKQKTLPDKSIIQCT